MYREKGKNNEKIKDVKEYLDERYDIWQLTNSTSDKAYYEGVVAALIKCNLTVLRNDDGEHKIF